MVFQSSGITFQCTKDSNLSRFSPWPVFYLPAYSHSSMCEVIPQWFWFELSWLLMMSFLSCAYWVFYVFFGEMCIEILYLFPVGVSAGFFFFFWSLTERVPYILWTQVPFQTHDLQRFSPILWVVFSLSWWYSLKYRSFKLWWSPVYGLFSIVIILSVLYLRNFNSILWRFMAIFSLKSFIALVLTLKSPD